MADGSHRTFKLFAPSWYLTEPPEPVRTPALAHCALKIDCYSTQLSRFTRTFSAPPNRRYRCHEALSVSAQIEEFDSRHYATGWVLVRQARALFELTLYDQAAELFKIVRAREPYRVEGMEIYSTILWHLHSVCVARPTILSLSLSRLALADWLVACD